MLQVVQGGYPDGLQPDNQRSLLKKILPAIRVIFLRFAGDDTYRVFFSLSTVEMQYGEEFIDCGVPG